MFQLIVIAWRIDRGCSPVLEHAKPDLIQQPSSWLLIYRDGSNKVVQVCSFIKPTRMNKPVNRQK